MDCISPKFSAPPAAKLYVGCENVYEVKEQHGPPLSPCQVSMVGWEFARGRGGTKLPTFFTCLFVRHAFER